MLKQLATPKESHHVSIKQQNGKVQDEFGKKKGGKKRIITSIIKETSIIIEDMNQLGSQRQTMISKDHTTSKIFVNT